MLRLWPRALVLSILAALLIGAAYAAANFPALTGRVVDDAHILSPVATADLERKLADLEQKSQIQLVVATVPSLDGQEIEPYANALFRAWKLGEAKQNNGALLLIAPKERRMRIEVGYGLEGTLTDVASSRIIRNLMTPQFKTGNYDQGVEDGTRAVIAQLEGQADVAPDGAGSNATKPSSNGFSPPMPWPMRILFGAFIFGIIGLFTFIGVMTPGFSGWFLYVFLIPFWAMFPVFILGMRVTVVVLAVYLVGFPAAKLLVGRTAWYAKAAQDLKTKGRASVGGFTVMGGGFSGGGSSGGGGGFAGGGGGSGGGGSSGSW